MSSMACRADAATTRMDSAWWRGVFCKYEEMVIQYTRQNQKILAHGLLDGASETIGARIRFNPDFPLGFAMMTDALFEIVLMRMRRQ
ncbi:MAG: hypothetical protein Q7K57_24540 [Burkholderiaceae bacterium]|nr:hypothetical protein [Burkholderiaceae bacterium]